jgi:hypothetical protein
MAHPPPCHRHAAPEDGPASGRARAGKGMTEGKNGRSAPSGGAKEDLSGLFVGRYG